MRRHALWIAVPILFAVVVGLADRPRHAGQARLPVAGQVLVDTDRGEVVLHAVTRHPSGTPCIDAYGQRVQAFVGCGRAAGRAASMADYFVFLVDAPAEDVAKALVRVGARPRVAYGMAEGHRRAGLRGGTTAADYLQGDPVTITVGWRDPADGGWVERPYQDFCTEQVAVDGRQVEKPWTPSFVFHGSGAVYGAGTGCIACPCDCAGGLIADNRFPLYDPKPTVRFDTAKAPPAGTEAYVRIRPAASGRPTDAVAAGELLRPVAAVESIN